MNRISVCLLEWVFYLDVEPDATESTRATVFFSMRDNDPPKTDIEAFIDDEERSLLSDPKVPDEVKNEIRERLDMFRDLDAEHEHAEDAREEH